MTYATWHILLQRITILHTHLIKDKEMAGKDWVVGFRKGHWNLTLRKPEATYMARAQGFNKTNVDTFLIFLKLYKTTTSILLIEYMMLMKLVFWPFKVVTQKYSLWNKTGQNNNFCRERLTLDIFSLHVSWGNFYSSICHIPKTKNDGWACRWSSPWFWVCL